MRIKFIFIAILIAACGFICGCAGYHAAAVKDAQGLIQTGQAKCVLVKNGRIIAVENGRGVSPLLAVYQTHKAQMENTAVVDKVVGRAAAAIAICGKVSHMHGELMSEDAVSFLARHNITSSYTKLVPRILNNKMDGLCPLEQAVLGIEDPALALAALKAKVAEMSAGPDIQ